MGEAYALRYDGHHLKPQDEWVRLPENIIVPVFDKETGLVDPGKTETRPLVPAIIDKATFDKAQQLRKIRREESLRHNPFEATELLRCGFVRCGYCNRVMVVNRYKRVFKNGTETFVTLYACRHFYKEGNADKCPHGPSILADRLDAAVWEYVGELLKDFELVEKAVTLAKGKRSFSADLQSIDRSVHEFQEKQQNLVESLPLLREVQEINPPKSY